MSELSGKSQLDPETIYRQSQDELRDKLAEQRRRFIESGPSELRDLRTELRDRMDDAMRAIAARHRIKGRLEWARREGAPEESLRAMESELEQASEAMIATKALVVDADARLKEAALQLKLGAFPSSVRDEAKRLMMEELAAIEAIGPDENAARYGKLGGAQFRLLRELDEAKSAGDSERVARLEHDLEVAQAEWQLVETAIRDRADRIEQVKETFRLRLDALNPSGEDTL